MKTKYFFAFITLCIVTNTFSQTSLNNYKYVIVENQFHFQNEVNEYNLNQLTRFLFKKHGFRPIFNSEVYPEDLKSNYCLALTSKIVAKGAFITKITIVLKDCNNNVVFSSEGKTKEKEIKKVYSIGIRKAFEQFEKINYKYTPNEDNIAKENTSNNEIEEQKAEIKSLKTEQSKMAKKTEDIIENEKIYNLQKANNELKEISKNPTETINVEEEKSYLKANSISNGFQLINSLSNEIEYVLRKTGMKNVFILKDKNGVIYKKNNDWVREYVDGNKTIIEFLDIRF